MKRRTMLRTCGLAAVPLAGCTGGPSSTETATDTPTPTPEPPRLANTDFSVTDSGCGQEVERASVSFSGRTVKVIGRTSAPDGCYEAFLDSAAYDRAADELVVSVATRSHTAAACVECIYEFGYEAVCRFENGLPGTVVVTHDGEQVASEES